jgi:4-amino-4-deoxy-L-arabinose transferase-like glycosyltransferase
VIGTDEQAGTRWLMTLLTLVPLIAITGYLYVTRLQYAPVYLASDEIKFALQARSIAANGTDLNGQFLPLYFSEPGFSAGRDPISIYVTALFLKVLPFSEWTVRLPSALVAVLDVILMFFLGRRIFKRNLLATAAAMLLALTPGHLIYGRSAVDVIYPLPFLLCWLLCLLAFMEREKAVLLFAATMCLGLGIYSYIAFMVMAPVYLLLTAGMLWERRSWQSYLVAVAGFVLPLTLLVRWYFQHPTQYTDLIGAYRLYDTHLNPLQGIKDLTSYFSLGVRSGVYWDFFNPSFLFFSGDSSLMNSTRLVGVFLTPVAILLLVGGSRACVRRRPLDLVLLAGLLTSPLAATLLAEVALRRALVMLPFVVLLAASGLDVLIAARQRAWRVAAVVLLAAACLQFRSFYVDYMSDYRVRSSTWFGGNIRDALVGVMRRAGNSPTAHVYLTSNMPFGEAYWQFFAVEEGRRDLEPTWIDPDRFDARSVSAPALLVLEVAAAHGKAGLDAAGWRKAQVITEPNGAPSFEIYEK